jgi:hypothetical protein
LATVTPAISHAELISQVERTGERAIACVVIGFVLRVSGLPRNAVTILLAAAFIALSVGFVALLATALSGTPVHGNLLHVTGCSLLGGVALAVIALAYEVAVPKVRSMVNVVGGDGYHPLSIWMQQHFRPTEQIVISVLFGVAAVLTGIEIFPGAFHTVGTSISVFFAGASIGGGWYCAMVIPTAAKVIGRHPPRLFPLNPADTPEIQMIADVFRNCALGVAVVCTTLTVAFSYAEPMKDAKPTFATIVWVVLSWAVTTYSFGYPYYWLSKPVADERRRQLRSLDVAMKPLTQDVSKLSESDFDKLQRFLDLRSFVSSSSASLISHRTVVEYVSSLILPVVAFIAGQLWK